jgi:hypothetical protein
MAILKSFEAVYYSGKVDFKSTILQPLPPKMIYIKKLLCLKFFVENILVLKSIFALK